MRQHRKIQPEKVVSLSFVVMTIISSKKEKSGGVEKGMKQVTFYSWIKSAN